MRASVGWSMAVLVLVTACGGGGGEPDPVTGAEVTGTAAMTDDASSPSASPDASSAPVDGARDFCTAIAAAGDDLVVLDEGAMSEAMVTDLVGTFTRASAAAEAIVPPDDLAADWAVLRTLVDAYAARLAEVDPADGGALNQAMGELAAEQDATALDTVAQLGTEIESRCGSAAAGSAGVADACALLTATDLAAAFPGGPPVAAGDDYGAGFTECVWETGNVVVRLSILPVADLNDDYLDLISGAEPVAGLAGGVAFADVVGIGHTSSGGRTVAFESDAGGVMVAVRTGGATDDAALAGTLAATVAGAL